MFGLLNWQNGVRTLVSARSIHQINSIGPQIVPVFESYLRWLQMLPGMLRLIVLDYNTITTLVD